ncbi:MAG TPA: hypothetical protein VKU00_33820, partial [Chthonomonadaceae bacterium]|nr:hypothetical protein [Chthonomonadaceae bacterium]
MSKASRPFSLSPVRVSKQTREMILTLYPNLRDHLNALAYWRILQYILFCNYPDRRTNKQILSYNVVASLVGAKPHDTRFRAGTWLDDFSGDVFPLDPSEWNYKEGRARTIDPEIDPRIWAALERDRERCRNEEDAGWVLFDTGELASRRKWKAAIRAHDKAILQAEVIPSGHPGLPVMEFLNNQPPHSLIKIIKANLPRLDAAVEAMPRHTEHERLRYQYSRCLADHLLEHQKMRYTVLENSPRVYSRQMTVNQLPRELRKIALSGAVELDLKACQLAIVAR